MRTGEESELLKEISSAAGSSSGAKRVLVIGLDGGTFKLLKPLCEAGLMPNLQRLVANGARGILRSTIPPISAAAWSTFITGKNPGKHGILHFVSFDWQREVEVTESGVEIAPGIFAVVNANSIREPTLWQMVSEAGKRVAAINVPMTYPPKPLNGLMVACMLTPPGAEQFTYPPELKRELGDYEIELDIEEKGEASDIHVIRCVTKIMEKRGRVALRLMEKEPWDLFMIVFTETDRIQHRFWHCLLPSTQGYNQREVAEYQPALHAFYANLDAWVGRLVEAAGPEVNVVLMSDHGFTSRASRRVYVQTLAHELGLFTPRKATWIGHVRALVEGGLGLSYKEVYMALCKVLPRNLVARAFRSLRKALKAELSLQKGQVVKLHEFIGAVSLTQQHGSNAAPALAELRERLARLRDPVNGNKLVSRVVAAEEIYSGPFTEKLPPLLFFLDNGYGLSNGFGRRGQLIEYAPGKSKVHGVHDTEGILILCGPNVCRCELTSELHIQDVTATIMYLLGLAIPDDLDGRVLTEALDPGLLKAYPVHRAPARRVAESPQVGLHVYSGEEQEAVERRLRGLGYFD